MNPNKPHSEGNDPGDAGRPQPDLNLDAALIEYHALTKKWAAMEKANQAAYREPPTLSIRQAAEQMHRDYKLTESMFIDATEFIGRMLGTGNPYKEESPAEGKDIEP